MEYIELIRPQLYLVQDSIPRTTGAIRCLHRTEAHTQLSVRNP